MKLVFLPFALLQLASIAAIYISHDKANRLRRGLLALAGMVEDGVCDQVPDRVNEILMQPVPPETNDWRSM